MIIKELFCKFTCFSRLLLIRPEGGQTALGPNKTQDIGGMIQVPFKGLVNCRQKR